jgi:hypothetical protein
LSAGRRTWKRPSAAAVSGAARANPRGPAMTASRSCTLKVRAGGRRTIWRCSSGVMTLPSRKCTKINNRTVSRPFPGLMASASKAAGTTERIGPKFGIKVIKAAMMPRVPASGTPSSHSPTVTSVPTSSMDNICASSHHRRLRTALAAQSSRVARWRLGVARRIPEK